MTAEELLATMAEPLPEDDGYCIIDPETRVITIPPEYQLLGVESDEKAERIYFKCPKIVGDDIDLSKLALRVNFRNAGRMVDQYRVDDVAVDGDNITFSWLLSRRVTQYEGDVNFIVCAVRVNDDATISNEWNTTIANATVLEGLETDYLPEEEEQARDLLTELILEATKQIEDKAEKTLATIPSDYTTAAQNALSAKNEVEDIRVGADGATYESAGEAVKKQYTYFLKQLGSITSPAINRLSAINILDPTKIKDNKACWRTDNTLLGKVFDDQSANDHYSVILDVIPGSFISINNYVTLSNTFFATKNDNNLGNLLSENTPIEDGTRCYKVPDNAFKLYATLYMSNENAKNKAVIAYGILKNSNILLQENFPYGSVFSEVENTVSEVENTVSEVENITVIGNLANNFNIHRNKFAWCAVGSKPTYNDNDDYDAVAINVSPGCEYSFNIPLEQLSFSGLIDDNGIVISTLDSNLKNSKYITIPNNTHTLIVSYYKKNIDDLVVLQGHLDFIETYNVNRFPQGEKQINSYDVNTLDRLFKDNLQTIVDIWVSNDGDDNTGDGSKNKPYKTIMHANAIINDNSPYKRYRIIVKDGTYTDMETFYAGQVGDSYQGIMAKSYVTYMSESGDPNKCIFEWDGKTGFDQATDANTVNKCFFHVNNDTIETEINGIKFIGKNLRYCLHFEANSNSSPIIENCIFEWGGCEFIRNRPVVGMGGCLGIHIIFKNCKFYNSDNTAGIQWHDNTSPIEYTMEEGEIIELINCWFDNLNIQVRSGNYDRESVFALIIERCSGINIVYPTITSGNINYWRCTDICSRITDNKFINCDDSTTYPETTVSK